MPNFKNRILTLALAGLMAGQAILPVSAAEITDAAQGTEDTEPGIMLIEEAEPNAGEVEEPTGETSEAAENEHAAPDTTEGNLAAPDTAETETTDTNTADEASTESATEEFTEEIVIEPVVDTTEENTDATAENSDSDVTILSDEATSGGDIVARVYGVDPFDAEYSAGYIRITNSKGHGLKYGGGSWSGWAGSNKSRSDNVYIDHLKSANVNGIYYDIREYTWMSSNNDNYAIDNNGTVGAVGSNEGQTYREMHFYEAGHCGDSDYEVSFCGVLKQKDNDTGEGFSFYQGLIGVWLNKSTTMTKRNAVTWRGTQEINGDATDAGTIWAEVKGTPEKPLLISYWQGGSHSSEAGYYGNSISYKIVSDGKHDLPDGAQTTISAGCAHYANYNLVTAQDYKYYEFDGWYTDSAMSDKSPDTILVAKNMTFYGTYHKVAGRIDTEVVGGTITEAVDYIDYGEDMTIEYAPNDGYFLDTVTVDGEQVDPDQFKDNYLFQDIQNDHQIKVVYVKAEEPVKTVANAAGKNVDNTFIANGDTVTYSISVKNPASTTKTFTITDELPADMEYVSADHDGKNANGVVTWTLQLDGGAGETVSVQVKANKSGVKYANSAKINVGNVEISSNEVTTWTVADSTKSVKDVDGNNVDGEFLVNGETVTYIIAVKNPADDTRTFTITDKIPANMEYISADHDGKVANGVITWTLQLDGGAEETVRFQAKAMKADAHYVNSADVTVEDIKTTTNETSNWIMENPVKAVSLNGDDANGSLVEADDELTYTITVKNPADKAATAKVTDELPDNTAFVSADNDGKEAAGTVTWQVSLKANETRTLTVVVKVQDGAKNSTLANMATVYVNGSTYETNETKNYVLTDPVKAVMQGSENIEGKIVEDGDEVKYTITVTNPADEKQDITVTDNVPDELEILKADNSGKINGQKVTWTLKDVPAHTSKTVSITCEAIGTYSEQSVANKAQMTIDGHLLTSNKVQITIKAKEVEDTVITHKTINNETENNKIVNNETVNNTVENNVEETTDSGVISGYRNVNTGDMARTGLLLAIAGTAAIGLGIYYYRKRR